MSQLALALLLMAPPDSAQEVVEPRSGTRFVSRADGMSLLGAGLRTRTMLKVKVYAIGLYVAEAALAGPLAEHKGRTSSPAFYERLVRGDFSKQLTLKFLRDLSREQVQKAFRQSLAGADKARVESLVSLFSNTRKGDEWVLRWALGGTLETVVAGRPQAPIPDKAFAAAVFGIWLGEKPAQQDLKQDLVARAPLILR